MILVVGASGLLGGRIARLVLQGGHRVRVLSREPSRLRELGRSGAEVVRGDLRDPESLRDACRGVSRVITTANSFMGRGADSPARIDGEGNRNLIDAARGAAVEQFVFVSGAVMHRASPVDFFRVKAETEDYLRESGIPFTILRAGAFMEVWGEIIGGKAAAKGVATVFGTGRNPMNFVAVEDVARVAARVLEDPQALGKTIEFGGPENLTPIQVAALYAEVLGKPVRPKHVPRAAIRVLSALLRPFQPATSRMMKAGLDSDTGRYSIDPPGIPDWLGIRPTTFREWLHRHVPDGTSTPAAQASLPA